MSDTVRINVNGKEHAVVAAGDTPLLYILRNDLGLNGPKFGCGLGQCGACTVEDQAVVTLEGLAGSASIDAGGGALRYAAADVRAFLLEMAATRLSVSVASLKVDDGMIVGPAGKHVSY
jgi:nicotinate dehydrogenase subunit A